MIINSEFKNRYNYNSSISFLLKLRTDLDFIPIALLKDIRFQEYKNFKVGNEILSNTNFNNLKKIFKSVNDGNLPYLFKSDTDNLKSTLRNYVSTNDYHFVHNTYLNNTYCSSVYNILSSLSCVYLSKLRANSSYAIAGTYSIFNISYKPYYIATIKSEDLEQYKLCTLMGENFPNNKVTILYDTVHLNTLSSKLLHRCIKQSFTEVSKLGFNMVECNNLYDELFTTISVPKLPSIVSLKMFQKTVSYSFIQTMKGIDTSIPDKYKKCTSKKPSTIASEIYQVINSNKKVKTMTTITLEKSKLAQLLDLGQTVSQIALSLGIDEKDLKDSLVTFGLIKSKKQPKTYIINLVEDI